MARSILDYIFNCFIFLLFVYCDVDYALGPVMPYAPNGNFSDRQPTSGM